MRKIFLFVIPFMIASCGSGEVKWDATGTFESTEITVSAEANGRITALNVADGEQLTAGQVIGEIDTVQLYLKRCQLEAALGSSVNRRQDVAKQIAATQQQIKWQQGESTRFEKLLAQNAATQKQVDDITNQIAVLQKQLIAQRSSLESANRSIADESQSIEIQIAQVNDQLKKSRITSPITGTVLVRYAEAGEFTAVGKPLFTIADVGNMYLRAYVTSDMLTKMKLGQQVSVYSDFGADEQRDYKGVVEWISSRGEFTPKSIQTRNERANMVYAVKVAVENDGYLKIGMYGELKL